MMKRKKAIFFLGIGLMALGVAYLVYSWVSSITRKQNIEDITSVAYLETGGTVQTKAPTTVPSTTESSVQVAETTTEAVTTTEAKEPYVSPINFEGLWEINTDIYAWLEIVDSNVDPQPILQHPTDNNYYLDHTPEHYGGGFPGSIFTYNVNAKDFTDFNTVIYGHRMNDGTMFTNLHDYRDETFLKEHRTVNVYLPDRQLVYTIFAAVVYNDCLITDAFDFTDKNGRKEFLDSIFENRDLNSHILTDVPVTEDDRIITLSTCIKWQENNRYLIVAVLTDEID